MKKTFFISFVAALFVLAGCVKDSVSHSYQYTIYRPVLQTVNEVISNIKASAATAVRQPGKLYIKGNYIYLNEIGKGIHIIDNANPAQPKNLSFIPIPGNVDLAVKDNILYADFYQDLLSIDISNPAAPRLVQHQKDILKNYNVAYYGWYADSGKVVVDWVAKDTTFENWIDYGWCGDRFDANSSFFVSAPNKNVTASAPAAPGISGSMARFTIAGQYLYTVSIDSLSSFDVTNAAAPVLKSRMGLGWGIETIYPFKDKLFIGSQTGMFVYNITDPANPQALGSYQHIRKCDPVVADDDYAYVTLRSGNACGDGVSQLEVLDISNVLQPELITTYTLSQPFGLSKDGNLVFICDGVEGLKLLDVSNLNKIKQLQHIRNLETYDVIAWNGIALVVAKDGLYQYSYDATGKLKFLSKLSINR